MINMLCEKLGIQADPTLLSLSYYAFIILMVLTVIVLINIWVRRKQRQEDDALINTGAFRTQNALRPIFVKIAPLVWEKEIATEIAIHHPKATITEFIYANLEKDNQFRCAYSEDGILVKLGDGKQINTDPMAQIFHFAPWVKWCFSGGEIIISEELSTYSIKSTLNFTTYWLFVLAFSCIAAFYMGTVWAFGFGFVTALVPVIGIRYYLMRAIRTTILELSAIYPDA